MVCAPVRSIIPSLKLGDYLSVQAHNPCSISHLAPDYCRSFCLLLIFLISRHRINCSHNSQKQNMFNKCCKLHIGNIHSTVFYQNKIEIKHLRPVKRKFGICFHLQVEFQRLERWLLVYLGFFELVLESLGKKIHSCRFEIIEGDFPFYIENGILCVHIRIASMRQF